MVWRRRSLSRGHSVASAPQSRTFRVLGDSKAGGHSMPESGTASWRKGHFCREVRQTGVGSGEDCGQQGIRCICDVALKMPTPLEHSEAGSGNSSLQTKQASVWLSGLRLGICSYWGEKLLLLTLCKQRGGLATWPCAVLTETFLAESKRHAEASLSSDGRFQVCLWGNSSAGANVSSHRAAPELRLLVFSHLR